ncbi:MAG: Lrp/AsnC ligand binding domain-containing protein [Bacteroidales bacterium]|nr:Lrp/AsnC ligand binding domain-containing protein [Bacteroidales bacterium]
MTNYQIDGVDRKILSFLVKNARMPFLEIARECGVSGAAIHQRVKKMENLGIITGSRLLVKPQALGLNVCAFIGVYLSHASDTYEVIEYLKSIPEVVECHFITGVHSLLLKVYCFDNEHLMDILTHTIQSISGVEKTETWISLDQAIERQVWVKDYDYTEKKGQPKSKRK